MPVRRDRSGSCCNAWRGRSLNRPHSRAVPHATNAQKLELLKKVKCFIFDCDGARWLRGRTASGIEGSGRNGRSLPSPGVIWLGDKVIDGVPETLDMLRGMVGQGTDSSCTGSRIARHSSRFGPATRLRGPAQLQRAQRSANPAVSAPKQYMVCAWLMHVCAPGPLWCACVGQEGVLCDQQLD
jgi:hypothetical protein